LSRDNTLRPLLSRFQFNLTLQLKWCTSAKATFSHYSWIEPEYSN